MTDPAEGELAEDGGELIEPSGDADPEGQAPWVMQLVTRIEKTDPPTRSAVCAASATAVATLLDDPRARTGGEWAPEVVRWTDGRIRKHSRRARGAAWQAVQTLPGVTAEVQGAQVRAFVPCATDAIPAPIAKLQLAGSELADPDARAEVEAVVDGPVVVTLCAEPPLSLGKAAAAAGHAAQLALYRMDDRRRAAWAAAGYPVVIEQPTPARWAHERTRQPVQVIDGGLTDVAPGTCTATARWR
ncbi:peptidyl-tRNA hydrolase [Rhodococcus sp. X156]|uniref:peptidyl-tRNA hydrolase n=1 Tax=Rhodococcus sp. X156 TaxID=2499145 RepID=UPI0019CF9041|nr:peptidyl-tRNA hydrolase [Rhodococcus sp. X156]